MNKLFALCALALGLQLGAVNQEEFATLIGNVHQTCIPLIVHLDAQENEEELTEQELQKTLQIAFNYYLKKTSELSEKAKDQLVAALQNLDSIDKLKFVFLTLYDQEWGEILFQVFQQVTETNIGQVSAITQGIEAQRSGKSFIDYSYDKIKEDQAVFEQATPEEIQAAIEEIQNADQSLLIEKLLLDSFRPQ